MSIRNIYNVTMNNEETIMKATTFLQAVANIHRGEFDLDRDVLALTNNFGHTVAHYMAMSGYVFKRSERFVLDWKTPDGISVRQLQCKETPRRWVRNTINMTIFATVVYVISKVGMILNGYGTIDDVMAAGKQYLIDRSNNNNGPVTQIRERRAEFKRNMIYVNMQRNKRGLEPWDVSH